MVSITVSTPGKPTISLDFPNKHPDQVLIKDVKAAVHAKFPKFVANRQRLTLPQSEGKPLPLTDEKASLGSYGVGQGAALKLKDLGAQVPYRLLYICEYAGVIFVNPAMLHFSHLWWGPYYYSRLQLTVRHLLFIHFVKRTLESAFLHSFSRPTVPLSYVFRNILYYWGVCGLLMGLTLYRPAYSATALRGTIYDSPAWVYGWAAFELTMEAVNFYTHVHLASLRTPPGTPRKFPTGFSFGTIVCANYFWETLGVLALVIMTGGDFGCLVYFGIATAFMRLWASQKYRRYKKEFGARGYPGKRWVYFPPLY